MKKFTKLAAVTTATLALFFSTSAKAQTAAASPWRLGIGLEAGIPTGNANDISDFEIGGTARLQYDAAKTVSVILTSGYYDMIGKSAASGSGATYPSLGMVPLKIGAKIYIAPTFYVDGEAGAGFDTSYEDHTKLILSPGVGYDSKTWDISLRYENYSGENNSFGLIGLCVAYGFAL